MSVDIEPLELNFQRPFTIEVARTLTIKNPTTSPLAFKVKTTAPKQYCVRPNAGRIEPGQDFTVTVLLQAMKSDPPLNTRCRDKFLVQSAPITPDKEFASIASVLESAVGGKIQERKIRVNWLAANSSHEQDVAALLTPSKHGGSNSTSETPETSHVFSSPRANADAASFSALSNATNNVDGELSQDTLATTSRPAASETANSHHSYEELKSKLHKAEAQLATLRDGGLRQRNVKGATGDDKKSGSLAIPAVKPTARGVSVPIVALLCLLSFLLAYIFF